MHRNAKGNDMSIRLVLVGTFTLILLLVLGMWSIAMTEMRNLRDQSALIAEMNVTGIRRADQLATLQSSIQTTIRNYLIAEDGQPRKEIKASLKAMIASRDELIGTLRTAHAAEPDVLALVDEIAGTAKALDKVNAKVMEVLLFGSVTKAGALLRKEGDSLYAQTVALIGRLQQASLDRMALAVRQADQDHAAARLALRWPAWH